MEVEPDSECMSSELTPPVEANSLSATRFLGVLQKQQDIKFRQDKYFDEEMLPVVEKCCDQVRYQLQEAIESDIQCLLGQYNILKKISQKKEVTTKMPTWRPTGIPFQDFENACGASLRLEINPQFERILAEAEKKENELQSIVNQKKGEVEALETHITAKLESLDHIMTNI